MALIHLDAGVIIGFLDANDTHHRTAHGALTAAQERGDRLAMAASAFAECLVAPSRSESAVRVVRQLFERLPIAIAPLDEETAVIAARLRASYRSLRLPDALVIATAIVGGADQLLTTDRRWPAPRSLKMPGTIKHL